MAISDLEQIAACSSWSCSWTCLLAREHQRRSSRSVESYHQARFVLLAVKREVAVTASLCLQAQPGRGALPPVRPRAAKPLRAYVS